MMQYILILELLCAGRGRSLRAERAHGVEAARAAGGDLGGEDGRASEHERHGGDGVHRHPDRGASLRSA